VQGDLEWLVRPCSYSHVPGLLETGQRVRLREQVRPPLFPYLLSDGGLRIVFPSLERTPSLLSHHFSVDSPAKSLFEIHQF
jgi:hypothetical protein